MTPFDLNPQLLQISLITRISANKTLWNSVDDPKPQSIMTLKFPDNLL